MRVVIIQMIIEIIFRNQSMESVHPLIEPFYSHLSSEDKRHFDRILLIQSMTSDNYKQIIPKLSRPDRISMFELLRFKPELQSCNDEIYKQIRYEIHSQTFNHVNFKYFISGKYLFKHKHDYLNEIQQAIDDDNVELLNEYLTLCPFDIKMESLLYSVFKSSMKCVKSLFSQNTYSPDALHIAIMSNNIEAYELFRDLVSDEDIEWMICYQRYDMLEDALYYKESLHIVEEMLVDIINRRFEFHM